MYGIISFVSIINYNLELYQRIMNQVNFLTNCILIYMPLDNIGHICYYNLISAYVFIVNFV